jgi:hypothetical protein
VERSGQRLWWILILLAILFVASSVLRFFDPSQATQNPYSDLELYAGTPIPATLNSILGILIGIIGILAVTVAEFGLSQGERFRAVSSPMRLFAAVLVTTGFVLFTLRAFRTLELTPDMAHYYYALDGSARHAPALLTQFIPLDTNGFFFHFGGALWALVISLDLIRHRPPRWFPAVVGIAYAGSFLSLLFFMATDMGFYSLVMTIMGRGLVTPAWFITLGIYLRRRSSEGMRVS